MSKTDYSSYILPVGIMLILYGAAKKFGLIKDAQQEQQQQAQLFAEYFSPNYYLNLKKKKGSVKSYTDQGAKYLAQQFYKSKGVFNDDEGMLYSAVKALQYKTQVSRIALEFNRIYKKDLAQYLSTFLGETELKRIYDYTNNLPTGYTAT